MVAQKYHAVYLPIGGLLFTSTAATLGIKSWLFFFFKNRRDEKSQRG